MPLSDGFQNVRKVCGNVSVGIAMLDGITENSCTVGFKAFGNFICSPRLYFPEGVDQLFMGDGTDWQCPYFRKNILFQTVDDVFGCRGLPSSEEVGMPVPGYLFKGIGILLLIGFPHGLLVLGRVDACRFQFSGFIVSLPCLFKGHIGVLAKGKPVFLAIGLSEFHSPEFGTQRGDFQIQAAAIKEFVGLFLRLGVFHLQGR